MPSKQIVDRLARTCGGDPEALRALWERAAMARQRLRFSHPAGPDAGPAEVAAEPALAAAPVAVVPPLPPDQAPSPRRRAQHAVLGVVRRRPKAVLLAASAVFGVLALLVAIGGFAYRMPLSRDAVQTAQSLPDLPAGGTFRARTQGPVPPAPPADVRPATNPSPRPRPSASVSPTRRPSGSSQPTPKPTATPTATATPPASPSPKPPNGPESIPGSLTFKSRFTANSCIDSLGGGEHPAYTNAPCDPSNQNQRWNVAVGSEADARQGRQELVTLTNVATGSCLDGDHSDDGNAWVQRCDAGAFQLWEVFLLRASNEDDQVVTVFKSWGAWQQDRAHVCLYADAGSAALKLRTCDATSSRQQWY